MPDQLGLSNSQQITKEDAANTALVGLLASKAAAKKFAKAKGIVKHKRSKMVWDEERQVWAPRFGYGRANNPKDKLQDWVIEAKPGDDPSVDPFEARATAGLQHRAPTSRC